MNCFIHKKQNVSDIRNIVIQFHSQQEEDDSVILL